MKQIREFNIQSIYNLCVEQGYITASTIDYKTFNKVVRDFHKEISREIMLGYPFFPGSDLGIFQVINERRKGRTINWGESNKLKQAIIDRGEVPFSKETAPNGKEWFVYFTDDCYYKWNWRKLGNIRLLKNIRNYMFKASGHNRRNIGKIVKENSEVIDKYGVYK